MSNIAINCELRCGDYKSKLKRAKRFEQPKPALAAKVWMLPYNDEKVSSRSAIIIFSRDNLVLETIKAVISDLYKDGIY